MSKPLYTTTGPTGSAIPGTFRFEGPGMGRHANEASFHPEHAQWNAERVTRWLGEAYEAGKAAAREEIRNSLGLHDTPWGMKVR